MRRRRRIAATVVLALLLTALPAWTAAARPTGELTSLGVPMSYATTVGGAVGESATGEPEVYTVASRDNDMGVFYVVDANTGAVKHQFDLGRGVHSYGVAVAPDGTVYISTTGSGQLLRWQQGADELEDLGRLFESESHLYKLTFDEQGNVYGGTYPSGKVFRYDVRTDEVHDYGQAAEGQSYVRSIGLHGNTLYAGTQPHAHLVAIDVDSGERSEVQLPEGTDPDQVVYDINIVGDLLFTRLTKTGLIGTLLVKDLRTGEWIDSLDGVSGLDVTQRASDGKVYFAQDGVLTGYDPETREVSPTSLKFEFTAQLRSLGLGTVDDYPGESVLGMVWTGEVFRYNPETGEHDVFESEIETNPVRMRSLEEGQNGEVLTGGTGTGAFAAVDPESGEVREDHRFSEVMGMHADDQRVYLGAYPRGRVYSYDRDQPWEWANIDEGGKVNPSEIYNGDASNGDRPFAIVGAGEGRLAFGTVNKSGYLGGSLVLHDIASGENTEFPEPVPEQSVISIAHRDGVLYVGTSVYGGYGAEETQTEAKLFAWDIERGEKLWETVPVAGERTVSDLAFGPDGTLWGLTAGVVFQVSTEDGSVLSEKRHADYEWPIDGAYAVGDLDYNEADGAFYASIPNLGLAKVDSESGESEVLTDRPVYRMFVHSNGDVFANDGAELLRYRPAT
ncbi:putative pyrroloquinoline-quinone binding quinoprotein [Tamaricihabitans halophyticus]|uniref:Putative pyrroloquinoline-quinone binding quinoprotein n=1 Tax=Tamaricihabitans halophyticus TaxID=1262583 RepID=A0A4R2QWC6_9PSEU|nr:PQQ-binding-like beta-propeller repeat protein [Tamaricihabitans halophyticus]TCP54007.1 putative pyrroloquinoline-quinone binding quinoprotein [Tamaricihabitans halophyticus]